MPRLDVKLFATDLDGTVLFEDGEAGSRVTARTAAALRALQDTGCVVALASGRMHESIERIASHMGLRGPIISYNGAMLRLHQGGAWAPPVFHLPLEAAVAAEVVRWCEPRGLALHYYLDGKLYARRFSPWWDIYEGRTASPMVEVDTLERFEGRRPTKLLLFAKPETVLEARDLFKPALVGRADVVVTHDEYLEFMDPQANKGRALEALRGMLGVDRAAVAAAGDGHNDIQMLDAAGVAIAVENGRDALKARAGHLVAPPQADGLARFIEENLL